MANGITWNPCKSGKVRDIYDPGHNKLIIVTTDRISAFDYVLPSQIPDKGKILNQISYFWTDLLDVPYHCFYTDNSYRANPTYLPEPFREPELLKRLMHVEKAEVVPFECVVRGYLCGSGWKEYQTNREVCGVKLPAGLRENQQLHTPIFTPATKAETGHDENVTFEFMASKVGLELASELEQRSLQLYIDAAQHAWSKGIIIADTKFEFGILKHQNDTLVLIDEVLTPDSSRFWPLEHYLPGQSVPSFDKQFVRDWLSNESGWDKNSPPPALPEEVIQKTREKYIEAYEKLTGTPWEN